MMKEAEKIVCPACGVEMNRHALKINYGAAAENLENIDPDLGGVLEEAHACPECGKTLMRRADASAP